MSELLKADKRTCRELIPTVRILHEEGWLTDEEVGRIEALNEY